MKRWMAFSEIRTQLLILVVIALLSCGKDSKIEPPKTRVPEGAQGQEWPPGEPRETNDTPKALQPVAEPSNASLGHCTNDEQETVCDPFQVHTPMNLMPGN